MTIRTLTHDGQTLTLKQWAKETKQTPFTLRYRLDAGWSLEQALYQPLHNRGPKRGQVRSSEQLEERCFNAKAVRIKREHAKFVKDIDRVMTAFATKLNWLLRDDDTPGVGDLSEN